MITSIVRTRNLVTRFSFNQLGAIVTCKNHVLTKSPIDCVEGCAQRWIPKPNLRLIRNYCAHIEPDVKLPNLLDEPLYINIFGFKPFIALIKCSLLRFFVDKDFHLNDFSKAVTQAVTVVTQALTQGDHDFLLKVVADKALQAIKNKVDNLSLAQKMLLNITTDDILLVMPFDTKIVTNKDETNIEIKVLATFASGFGEWKKTLPEEGQLNAIMKRADELPLGHRIMANITFARTYTKQQASPWIITYLNYCSMSES
ncbi:m-AAA protease-interacting protein 1, mitochondrial-like [Prorops nasuta]|uniref:m-AAA protease-interacting protein 1, mitochondrial-like n=1 Tax=Prorops nasuta TaxID=863751 RepID=UPI0034CE47F1